MRKALISAAAAAVVVTGVFAPVAASASTHRSRTASVRQQQIDFWRTHGYLVPNVRSYLAQKAAADRRAGVPASPSIGRTGRAPTVGASWEGEFDHPAPPDTTGAIGGSGSTPERAR